MVMAKQAEFAAMHARLRDEFGVHVNYVHPMMWLDRKVWAIGSRLYTNRPPDETFHEFILQVLRDEFGQQWYEQQLGLPEENRHFVMRCFDEWARFTQQHANPDKRTAHGMYAVAPNGWTQYLLALAWDVATLIHTTLLPEKLMSRLRSRDQFQGARYEVAIAAMFARLDCEIVFLDEDEKLGQEKRVEFVATHRPTSDKIAVEAKSRHRTGVLNRGGEPEIDMLQKDARAVRQLFNRALKKAPESTPFMIFIDINAPINEAGPNGPWQKALTSWLDELPAPTVERPSIYNALHVTNFSSHYDRDATAHQPEAVIQLPDPARTPIKAPLLNDLHRAIVNYGRVPAFAEDGALLD
jgi:hypothetical protein